MRLAFESVDSGKQIALPKVVGHPPLGEGFKRTKSRGRRNFSLFPASLRELGHLISCPWTGIYIILFPGSQTSAVRLNYTTSSPGSSVYRPQILELLSLRNQASQSFIINLYLHINTSFCFCFSAEP